MKATLIPVVWCLLTLSTLADEFALKGSWYNGRVEQISKDGTKVYVVDADQSYKGWWAAAADLDAASRAKLGLDTTAAEKVMLAEKRAAAAEAKAAEAQRAAAAQIQYERDVARYTAEEVAKLNRPDARDEANAKRVQAAREAYQLQLQGQQLQLFNQLVEVQQLELLRRLGYLR